MSHTETTHQVAAELSLTRKRRFLPDYAYPIITVVLIGILWEIACQVLALPAHLLPAPSSIAKTMVKRADILAISAFVTTMEILIGFLLSIVVGVVLSLLITNSRVVERSLYPLLIVSQAIPKVALAPLFVVWFGFGWEPKILVTVLIAFFPIVVSLTTGIRSVPVAMRKLALSMGASRFDTLKSFLIPHSLPHFFSGLKVAITLAVSGAIVGEFVGADRGLGYLLLFANGQMDSELLFASIIVLAILGILFFYLLLLIEKRCLPWHASMQDTARETA